MIAVLTHVKGGVGKSTLALNLAIARAMSGRDVLAVDGDPQLSLVSALANRQTAPISVTSYSDGQVLRQQVELAAKRYEDIIIDCPGGRYSSTSRAALMLADKVIIPFQPRSFDVWSLDDMAKLLQEARSYRDIDAFAVLSMADPRGTDNAAAAAEVPKGITYIPTFIGRRKAIAEAASRGMSILELPNMDFKAAAEMQAFVTEVFA